MSWSKRSASTHSLLLALKAFQAGRDYIRIVANAELVRVLLYSPFVISDPVVEVRLEVTLHGGLVHSNEFRSSAKS